MIYLASDHRGYELKEKIKIWLSEWGYEHTDMGAFGFDPTDDYPDFVHHVAKKISENPNTDRAIILCGSGQGEAMIANRYKGVRAMVYYGGSEEVIISGRRHNNSNVLSLGVAIGDTVQVAKLTDESVVRNAVKLWLETKFSGAERHVRRINKIDA